MQILTAHEKRAIKAAIFDFDGTLSTLRYGWESVMEPLMLEYIAGDGEFDDELVALVRDYIDKSTGIQTIHQMKWLVEAIKAYGRNVGAPDDPWFYKAEYNRRLMQTVEKRKADVLSGKAPKTNYLVYNCTEFLQKLKQKGVRLFAASGTDDADVKKEAEVLGLDVYFEQISGAKPYTEDCSKEAVINRLIGQAGYSGAELLVVGDGKVEIMLGRQAGALTLGVASDEERLRGINPVKARRLTATGAHAIVGDFENADEIINWI